MTKTELRDLERRTKAAREAAQKAEQDARDAKERARELSVKRVELEAELDLALWVEAQVELGVARENIDVANRVIRNLPAGPTFDEFPGA